MQQSVKEHNNFMTEVDQFNQSIHAWASHLKRNIMLYEHELKSLYALRDALI